MNDRWDENDTRVYKCIFFLVYPKQSHIRLIFMVFYFSLPSSFFYMNFSSCLSPHFLYMKEEKKMIKNRMALILCSIYIWHGNLFVLVRVEN